MTKINKTIIGLVIIFVLVYLANLMFPITFDDDFAYAEAGNPFLLQWQEYLNWHGRYLTHTIGRIILQLRDPAVNIIMAIMTTGFVISVGHFMRPRFWQSDDKQNLVILMIVSLILSCMVGSWTAYTQTIMFVSYHLTFTLLLLFLMHYFEFIKNDEDKERESSSYSTKIFVLGILAGFTHEQSVATIPLLILMIIYLKYQKRPIPSWFYVGFLGFVIGFTMLMSAPSMWSGARDGYGGTDNWHFLGQTYNWYELGFKRYFYSLANIMLFGGNAWLIKCSPLFVIFGILFHKNLKLNPDWTKQIVPLLVFVYSWLIVGVMMVAPLFWYAQFNFGLVFLYISVGLELQLYLSQRPDFLPKLQKITIGIVSLALIIYAVLVPVWINYHKEYHKVVHQIQEAKDNNIDEISVEPFSQYIIYTPFGRIIPVWLYTSSGFYNRMAKYYDIKKITPQ